MKKCTKCARYLSLDQFYRDRSRADGLYPQCKKCARAAKKADRERPGYKARFREYKTNWRQKNIEKVRAQERRRRRETSGFDALIIAQSGRCAICQRPETAANTVFHVDHNHVSGVVRGLLCSNCNTGLGLFADSSMRLEAAIAYLQEAK